MASYTSKCCHFSVTHYSFTTKGSLTLEKKMTAIINGHLTSQTLYVLTNKLFNLNSSKEIIIYIRFNDL